MDVVGGAANITIVVDDSDARLLALLEAKREIAQVFHEYDGFLGDLKRTDSVSVDQSDVMFLARRLSLTTR